MIEFKGVSKAFESHQVLSGANLKIEKGESVVIIGRSGSGKSVMLKHIIGLMKPDGGTVLVDGVDIASLSPPDLDRLRMRFGMLFQSAALFDSMTAFENVAFPLREHTEIGRAHV